MDGDKARLEAHQRLIEAWVGEKWPGAEQVTWQEEDPGYALLFTLNGERWGVGFKREYLEDQGTESLLAALLASARPLCR